MKRYAYVGGYLVEAPSGDLVRFDDAQAKIIDMQEHIDAQKLVEKIIYEHVEELKAQVAELRAALENAGEWRTPSTRTGSSVTPAPCSPRLEVTSEALSDD